MLSFFMRKRREDSGRPVLFAAPWEPLPSQFPRHGSGARRSSWRPTRADSVPASTAHPYRLQLAADRAQKSTHAAFCYASDRCFFPVNDDFRRTGTDGGGRLVCRLGPVLCPSDMEDRRECRREAGSGSRFWNGSV